MNLTEMQYGFQYGPATVQRLTSDDRDGWVIIGITTALAQVDVYVTKSGKVRVFKHKPGDATIAPRKCEMLPAVKGEV